MTYSFQVSLTDIHFENYTGSVNPINDVISFEFSRMQTVFLSNITVANSNLNEQTLLTFLDAFQDNHLQIDTLSFTNVRYSEGSQLVKIARVNRMILNNFVLRDVASSSLVDVDSVALQISQINLAFTEDILITGVEYENSSIGLISITGLYETPPSGRNIIFSDSVFKNCEIASQGSIIKTQGIETDKQVNIVFDNFEFMNVKFTTIGRLFDLSHQLMYNITVMNSRFENIEQGNIYARESSTVIPGLATSVLFSNITVDNVQQNEASFIENDQGATLFVENSSFTNMYIYLDGAVATSGGPGGVAYFSDSKFMNNSAQSGGVFNVKDGGTIKIYSSEITNNFAVTSGVIHVSSNGKFEVYGSFIHDNYASINPVSLLFDTTENSVISSTEIYSNHALSRVHITGEFSSCSVLCFLNQNFIDYFNSNFGPIVSENGNEYLFQLVFGSLSITNSTQVFNESAVVNSFVSTVTLSDISIRDFLMEDANIIAVSSTINIANLRFENFTINTVFDYLLDVSDSTLNVLDSTSVIFRVRSSTFAIDGIRFENLQDSRELGVISECSNSTISNITSTLSEVNGDSLFRIDQSDNITLFDFDLQNTQKKAIRVSESNVTFISEMNLRN